MFRRIVLTTAILVMAASTAMATPWVHPDEPSFAQVFNSHYGTSFVEDTMEGLADLMLANGGTVQSTWNTTDFGFLRVEVFDTGSTAPLNLRFGSGFSQTLTLSDPGPWTPPSRGLLPDGPNYINLRSLIGDGEDFQLYVGNTLMDASNSILAEGSPSSFLLGYNGGGFSGDADFNEPLIHMAETPIPAAVWLLGSGLLGLVGLRRKMR